MNWRVVSDYLTLAGYAVITCLDGHQMAKQGRAGPTLAIAAIGSFFAGCVATVLVAALGAPLTGLALMFGPAEYVQLEVLVEGAALASKELWAKRAA